MLGITEIIMSKIPNCQLVIIRSGVFQPKSQDKSAPRAVAEQIGWHWTPTSFVTEAWGKVEEKLKKTSLILRDNKD
jgi:hypothetical protein